MKINIPRSKLFYRGNLETDYKQSQTGAGNDWLIGDFCKFDSADARKTSAIEIKYWKRNIDNPDHKAKVQVSATEVTILLKGEIRGSVNGKKIIMKANDYVLIKPGIINNLVEEVIKDDTVGITIKVPSDPNDTIKCE